MSNNSQSKKVALKQNILGGIPGLIALATITALIGVSKMTQASDAKTDFKAANDALLKVKSYRERMTISWEGGQEIKTIEYAAPNRFHMVGFFGKGSEVIIVPEGTYTKGANGKWQKSPTNFMSSLIDRYRHPEFTDSMLKNEQVRLIGPDTLDGKPMMVYEIVVPEYQSKTRIWIGMQDHLPYKSETEVETKAIKMGGKTFGGKSKMTTLYTDYNAPVEIVAPTP